MTVDLGQSYSLDGATQTTLLHSYAFDVASTFSATTAVTATDRARNQTTQPFSVIPDTLPPLLTITVPPTVPLRFTVAWRNYNEWGKERMIGDNSLVLSFVVVVMDQNKR